MRILGSFNRSDGATPSTWNRNLPRKGREVFSYSGIAALLVGVLFFVFGRFLSGQVFVAGALVLFTASRTGWGIKERPVFHYGFVRPLFMVSIIVWVFSWYASEIVFVRDYVALYVGGKLAWSEPGAIYDIARQVQLENRVVERVIDQKNVLLFLYPPLVAFLMVPLSWLSFEVSYRLWFILNIYLFALAMYLISSRLGLSRRQIHALVSVALIWFPLYQTLIQGQTAIIVLILMSLFVLSWKGNDETSVGIWAGLLIGKPQFLPIPGLALVIKRKWRSVLIAGAVGTLVGLVPLAAVGSRVLADLTILYERMATGDPVNADFSKMHNLRSLAHFMGLGDLGWIAGCLMVLALLIWVLVCAGRNSIWTLVVLVLAALLVSPHLQGHDLVLLLLPAGLWLSAVDQSPTRSQWFLFLGLSLLVLLRSSILVSTGWPIVPVVLLMLYVAALYRSLAVPLGGKGGI
jgi:hypothetical protein